MYDEYYWETSAILSSTLLPQISHRFIRHFRHMQHDMQLVILISLLIKCISIYIPTYCSILVFTARLRVLRLVQ